MPPLQAVCHLKAIIRSIQQTHRAGTWKCKLSYDTNLLRMEDMLTISSSMTSVMQCLYPAQEKFEFLATVKYADLTRIPQDNNYNHRPIKMTSYCSISVRPTLDIPRDCSSMLT